MKNLIRLSHSIPWMPAAHEARLYITDEMPPSEACGTAFGFAFDGDRILLTRLRNRDWDIPGGRIEPGETPEQAAVREVWEETQVRVQVVELIGTQELENRGSPEDNPGYPYPLSVQMYFLCRVVEVCPFTANTESRARAFIAPAEARQVPTMVNHDAIYDEALRRVLRQSDLGTQDDDAWG